jgi:hypothetical protein
VDLEVQNEKRKKIECHFLSTNSEKYGLICVKLRSCVSAVIEFKVILLMWHQRGSAITAVMECPFLREIPYQLLFYDAELSAQKASVCVCKTLVSGPLGNPL